MRYVLWEAGQILKVRKCFPGLVGFEDYGRTLFSSITEEYYTSERLNLLCLHFGQSSWITIAPAHDTIYGDRDTY